MRPERIVVIPPTHEQTTPSFQIESRLLQPFLEFLKTHGIEAWQPPESLGRLGPHESLLSEIEIEAGTSVSRLEELANDFLSSLGLSNIPTEQ